MLSRAWKPLAGATVLIGGPTYAYYTWDRKPAVQTFDLGVCVRGPDGRPAMTTRTFSLLSKAEVDTRIREHARTETKRLAGGQWSWTTAAVASNEPIEDANANAILSRDDTVKGPAGDLLFWAVMDGHGGYHTSRLLSKVLIPAVAVELQTLNEDPETIAPKTNILQDVIKSVFGRQQGTPAKPVRFDADPTYVSLALQTAFANLDSELINAPIRLMAANIDQKARDSKILPDLSQHPMALATMLPAMSGRSTFQLLSPPSVVVYPRFWYWGLM
jgi:pyruvate dehydrogenase phosphatase